MTVPCWVHYSQGLPARTPLAAWIGLAAVSDLLAPRHDFLPARAASGILESPGPPAVRLLSMYDADQGAAVSRVRWCYPRFLIVFHFFYCCLCILERRCELHMTRTMVTRILPMMVRR